MSHIKKMLLNVIKQKMEQKFHIEDGVNQFFLKKESGTIEGMSVLI